MNTLLIIVCVFIVIRIYYTNRPVCSQQEAFTHVKEMMRELINNNKREYMWSCTGIVSCDTSLDTALIGILTAVAVAICADPATTDVCVAGAIDKGLTEEMLIPLGDAIKKNVIEPALNGIPSIASLGETDVTIISDAIWSAILLNPVNFVSTVGVSKICSPDTSPQVCEACTCGDWGDCDVAGIQSRSCNIALCAAQTQDCIPDCDCSDWGACDAAGYQSRSCNVVAVAHNKCGEQVQKCMPDCACTGWGACSEVLKTRGRSCNPIAVAAGNCGDVVETCTPPCSCGDWGSCTIAGTQGRDCTPALCDSETATCDPPSASSDVSSVLSLF